MNNSQQRQFYYYHPYQRGLGDGKGIPMEPITAGIQAVGNIVGGVMQYFTVKEQVKAQIETANIQANATKYVADKQVDIANIQAKMQQEILDAKNLDNQRQNAINYILQLRTKSTYFYDKIITARNDISPNIRYIINKHYKQEKINITDFATSCKALLKKAAAIVDKYTDKIQKESTIESAIYAAGSSVEVQQCFDDISIVYTNHLLDLNNILKATSNYTEDEDIATYFLALYFFDKYNFVFGMFASLYNAGKKFSDFVANDMPNELKNVDVHADWTNSKAIAEYKYKSLRDWAQQKNLEVAEYFRNQIGISKWRIGGWVVFDMVSGHQVFTDRKKISDDWNDFAFWWGVFPILEQNSNNIDRKYLDIQAMEMQINQANKRLMNEDGKSIYKDWNGYANNPNATQAFDRFSFYDYEYNMDRLDDQKLQVIGYFMRWLKNNNRYGGDTYEPPKENTDLKDAIKAKNDWIAKNLQKGAFDFSQVFFNELRLLVGQFNIVGTLKNKLTYYYDFEKQKPFISDVDFENYLTKLVFSNTDTVKLIFDNIESASVESVQIQFLKKIQVAVEKLSNDNEEYILGLIFSYITLGAGVPFLPKEIIKSIKTQLATIDSELQKECSQVIQEGLYLQYDFNEMLTKDSDFGKAYADEVWNGAYSTDTHNFEKSTGDTVGSFEDPFAILGVLNTGTLEKPLYEDFLTYLADAQKNFFVTGIDAVNVANYLAEKTDKMPVVNVGNLMIEVPILKNYNLKYKFTRYSFFLFLQTLHRAFINKQKRYVKESLQAILSGNKKIGTLSNSEEEKQAQSVLSNYEAGQINFQRISNPEYVFGNNQVYMLLQMGDVLNENKQSINLNAYLRLIYLLKEKYANFINEFEYDHLYVVTLANNKRVDTLPSSYEEGVAQQYADIASKEPAYLKALDNYIWVEDELTSIGDKQITLSVYNRSMTLLKENYGIKTPASIVNPESTATKPDSQVSDVEKTKKNQQSLLRTGLLTFLGYIIFK